MATISLKSTCFLQHPKRFQTHSSSSPHKSEQTLLIKSSSSSITAMPSLARSQTLGISETFTRLREQKKVAFIPCITAGDPDLGTRAAALKVLDSCGSHKIELGVPYSDPLADGPVIQAAVTRALARGTNVDAIISMLRDVVPEVSCPIAIFSYYNTILKRGIGKFMSIVRDTSVQDSNARNQQQLFTPSQDLASMIS